MAGEGGAAGQAGSGSAPDSDAPLPSIALGLWPTYASSEASDPEAQALRAGLQAVSAGARVLPIVERWDSLALPSGAARSATWARLERAIEPFREHGGTVALAIAVNERTLDARPLTGEWNSSEARIAIERTIDTLFDRYGDVLSVIGIGYEVDRLLAPATTDERAAIVAFLEHAVGYARGHDRRAETTHVAVSFTLRSWLSDEPPGVRALGAFGSAVALSFEPLDSSFELREPPEVAADLNRARELAEENEDLALPLVLWDAGYPTSRALGSTEGRQAEFVSALSGALEAGRGVFELALLNGLSDRSAADCALESEGLGSRLAEDEIEAWRASRCSMGFVKGDGTAKRALRDAIALLAHFR